jgi:hypothetical protein
MIWGTIVTGLQVFGYAIATAGLVYYGLGWNGIVEVYEKSQVIWNDRGQNLRGSRLTMVMAGGAVCFFLFVVWMTTGPATPSTVRI